MHVSILGRGPLAESLARLAEHARYAVQSWHEEMPRPTADGTGTLIILAGVRIEVETILASIAPRVRDDSVVVDATTATQDVGQSDGAGRVESTAEWIAAMLPSARVVRAFASVPAHAFAAVSDNATSDASTRLAVPLAGDDRQAKSLVAEFMHAIGVEAVDLGALTNVDVLEPGGALWGKAFSQLEMLEAVGWLSGDG